MKAPSNLLVAILLIGSGTNAAATGTQTDWSGGPGQPGPVTSWGDRFQSCLGISWRSIPGQMSLASTPLNPPVEHRLPGSFPGASWAEGCDLDRDGDIDILGAAWFVDQIAWWENRGLDPAVWTKRLVDDTLDGAVFVQAVDLDLDGYQDLLGAGWDGGQIAWWRSDGGSPPAWSRQTIASGFLHAHDVHAADLDGDGHLDVVGAAAESDEITWWQNDGMVPIGWTERVITADLAGARWATAVDLDGDGDLDVLGASMLAGEIRWWENRGGEPLTWTEHILEDSFGGAHGLAVTDLDQDGDQDVIGAGYSPGRLAWWANEGGQPIVWSRYEIQTGWPGALTVRAVDLDGDGDDDVLGTSDVEDRVCWWQNQGGQPIEWVRYEIDGALAGAHGVSVSDVDQDGDLDVLCAGYDDGRISWWEVTDFALSGQLTGSILDTGTAIGPATLSWTAVHPEGAGVRLQVRNSQDQNSMGGWTDELTEDGELGHPLDRYVQYRLHLSCSETGASPIFRELAVASAPEPETIAIQLRMPTVEFTGGDPCGLDLALTNPGGSRTADLYCLLEVMGEYWCHPSWRSLQLGLDHEILEIRTWEASISPLIPPFLLPDGIPPGGPYRFHAALFESATLDIEHLCSNIASVEFSFR